MIIEDTHNKSDFGEIKPLTQDSSNLPTFPTECLPNAIGNYVRAVSASTQTSADMAAVISLGSLAAVLQGKYVVQGKAGYHEQLSLYVLVVAAPGERKSSVMRSMTHPLFEYEQEYNESRKDDIIQYQHQKDFLKKQIAKLEKRIDETDDHVLQSQIAGLNIRLENLAEVKPVRFFADDCTSEALTRLMVENAGITTVISTEGGIFDIMAGRYTSGRANIDIWLKAHDGDSIRIDRIGRESDFIQDPALSAILCVQQVSYKHSWTMT